MHHFLISTDSCLDMLKSDINKHNIHVLPMTVITDEGTFKDDFESVKEYEEFYKRIGGGEIFKTASLNEAEATQHFKSLLKSGKDIIHFSLSSGISLTFDVVKRAAEKLNAKNSNKVYVVDTKSATQGQNLLVTYAAKLRDEGVFPHEAFTKVSEAINYLNVTFFVTDFDCLKRGGRVSGAQAMVGKLVGVRPVLDFDINGKLRVVQKVIGNKKALQILIQKLENFNTEIKLPIYIAHTGNFDVVDELAKSIKEKHSHAQIIKNYIGPTIGAHTGNGAIGLVMLGKKERS